MRLKHHLHLVVTKRITSLALPAVQMASKDVPLPSFKLVSQMTLTALSSLMKDQPLSQSLRAPASRNQEHLPLRRSETFQSQPLPARLLLSAH